MKNKKVETTNYSLFNVKYNKNNKRKQFYTVPPMYNLELLPHQKDPTMAGGHSSSVPQLHGKLGTFAHCLPGTSTCRACLFCPSALFFPGTRQLWFLVWKYAVWSSYFECWNLNMAFINGDFLGDPQINLMSVPSSIIQLLDEFFEPIIHLRQTFHELIKDIFRDIQVFV